MSELKTICLDGTCATNTEYSGTGIVSVNDGVISADAYSQAQIDTKLNKVVMTDLSLPTNPSTTSVVLTGDKVNIGSGATTDKEIPLPVASTTQAGVINAATYQGIVDDHERVESLLGGSVAVNDLSATPTQSELTTSWKSALGTTSEPHNGAQIWDTANNKGYTWFDNTNTWILTQDGTGATINVDTFTNNAEGLILGSTNEGQIFAETDGTGSVNGWDTLNATVNNKQDQLTPGAHITITNNEIDTTGVATTSSASADANKVILANDSKQLITSSNIDWTQMPNNYFYPRDSFSLSSVQYNVGFITNSAKELRISIQLPKQIHSSVTGATIVQTSGGVVTSVKGIAGNIISNGNINDYTKTVNLPGTAVRNSIELRLSKTDGTAFNVTNNTPIVASGTWTITFS